MRRKRLMPSWQKQSTGTSTMRSSATARPTGRSLHCGIWFSRLRGCRKYAAHGGTSVTDGMKWLQSRAKIIIDPQRCPWTAREFSEYEYALDKKTGEVMPGFVDAANHSIDMTRYALEDVWQKRGVQNA